MSLIERQTAVYNAIRNALGPYAPDITGTAFGEPILRNATAGAIAAMKPQLEAMQAFLRRFIEIEEGTDQTGFDPHVEQMLMDLAKEVRASLDRQGK